MSTTDQTPAQRKAAARSKFGCPCECCTESLDAYARACIDEAVAPAVDQLLVGTKWGDRINAGLWRIRKLLTERAGR